jgi:hypothetical protein
MSESTRIQGTVFELVTLRDLTRLSGPDFETALRWVEDRRAAEAKRQAEAAQRSRAITAKLTKDVAERHKAEAEWAKRNMPRWKKTGRTEARLLPRLSRSWGEARAFIPASPARPVRPARSSATLVFVAGLRDLSEPGWPFRRNDHRGTAVTCRRSTDIVPRLRVPPTR